MENISLKDIKRLRNLNGIAYIGERHDKTRVVLEREMLMEFTSFLGLFEEESAKKFHEEMINFLVTPNSEVRLG